MGTYIEPNKFNKMLGNVFIFDLEYVGKSPNLEQCFIWDIGITHLLSNASFQVSIFPDINPIPKPFSVEFLDVTHELLHQRNAVNFKEAWVQLSQFINTVKLISTGPIILMAHNCFKSDKTVLEIDCTRHSIKIPYSWYFFDTLIYCRKIVLKQPSYTLNDLHLLLFNSHIKDQHFAISDAIALKNILISLDIKFMEGPIYPAYHTSLQAVKWLGPSSERILFDHNIRSLEILINQLLLQYCDNQLNHYHMPLKQFIENYIIENYGIKKGNSVSISTSLIQNWIKGV